MSQTQKTRVSLILRVANREDVEAWRQFAEIYEPLVFRIAMVKGLQRADAEDLVQEVMSRVARSVGSWDPDPRKGSFRGWISTIARNLVIDFLRKNNRQPRTSDHSDIRRLIESTPVRDEAEYFDKEYERQLFLNAAGHVRDTFSDNTWQAFWETAVRSQPIAEVAQRLAMSAGAVYVARSRVMAKLKAKVESISCEEGR